MYNNQEQEIDLDFTVIKPNITTQIQDENFEKIFTYNELMEEKNKYKNKYYELTDINKSLSIIINELNKKIDEKDKQNIKISKENENKCKKYKDMYMTLLQNFDIITKKNREKSDILRERYFTIINLESKVKQLEDKIKESEKIKHKDYIYNDSDESKITIEIKEPIYEKLAVSSYDEKYENNIIYNNIEKNDITIDNFSYNKPYENHIIVKDTKNNDNIIIDDTKTYDDEKYRTYFTNLNVENIMYNDLNENIINHENNYNKMYQDYFSKSITTY
jgi:hypothetical protein